MAYKIKNEVNGKVVADSCSGVHVVFDSQEHAEKIAAEKNLAVAMRQGPHRKQARYVVICAD